MAISTVGSRANTRGGALLNGDGGAMVDFMGRVRSGVLRLPTLFAVVAHSRADSGRKTIAGLARKLLCSRGFLALEDGRAARDMLDSG